MKKISLEELKQLRGSEGMVLQGCGGDLQEWVDGIHEMLAEEGVFKNGDTFHEVYSFENEGLTCLLFDMEDVDLDAGKLAAWRLSTRENFGSMWLSDYLDNHIGMDFEPKPEQKPDCELIGQDGNIFNLMGIASKTLKKNGMKEQAEEMVKRITQGANSYSEALCIIGEYVNITGPDEEPRDGMGMKM